MTMSRDAYRVSSTASATSTTTSTSVGRAAEPHESKKAPTTTISSFNRRRRWSSSGPEPTPTSCIPTVAEVNVDQELDQMLRFFATGPGLYRASPFWADLGGTHVQQLESDGFENFKRTVNTRYFNWDILGILRH